MFLLNKLKSIYFGWKNYFFRGHLKPEVRQFFDDRLSVCKLNECEKLRAGVCTACGCVVAAKTQSLGEFCPENMWSPHIYEGEGGESVLLLSELPPFITNRLSPEMIGPDMEDGEETLDLAYWDKLVDRVIATGELYKGGRAPTKK